ncbi:MAG TPA: ABC transporter permease [Acidimicrobiales bacterium]|nr:ABC transporter permease [Acidimicrobiales bacterium]
MSEKLRRPASLFARNLAVQVKAVPYVWASGLLEPFMYLMSIGVGIGHLVGKVPGPDGHLVAYASFVAPGLLATSAMNGAVYECTTDIFAKLHWTRVYRSVIATPLSPGDIAVSEIALAVFRCSLYAGVFLAVMAGLGEVSSWWAILALPVAALIGAAFAAMAFAATCFMRSWTDFDKVTLATLPLFLFSGTFYPLSQLPGWLRQVVEILPLYPGVRLCRQLTLGQTSSGAWANVAYLAALAALGIWVGRRRVTRLLTP